MLICKKLNKANGNAKLWIIDGIETIKQNKEISSQKSDKFWFYTNENISRGLESRKLIVYK